MAEVTALRNNALPMPIYGQPFSVVLPILDADGDLVTGATGDSEISKNGDTFADCTNEATEIGSTGMYYLTLTGTEMTADVVAIQTKSSGKTTPIVLYPAKLPVIRTGTVGANAADGTTVQLDSSAVAVDDFYNGCPVAVVIDSVTEIRIISDYVGSTKVCSVSPSFNTAPDNNDTFTVYQPWGRMVVQAHVTSLADSVISAAKFASNALDAVWSTTTRLLTAGTNIVLAKGTGVTGFNDLSAAAVNAEVDTAISDVGLTTTITGRIDAAVSTRASQTSVDTIDDFLDTEVAAIKAKTDNLPSDPADASDIAAAFTSLNTKVDTIDDFLDTEIAAIKAKTDGLPSDPADASDIAASFSSLNTKIDTIDDFLDTEIAAIKAKTDGLPSDPADASVVAGLIDALPTAAEIVDAVWDAPITNHLDSGSTGAALNAAGSAGDPWTTPLPGAYGAGTAGYIVGENLDAPVSGVSGGGGLDAAGVRAAVGLASANLDTQLAAIDDAVDTEVAAIKAKTDLIPSDPADASDIAAAFSTVNSTLSTISGKIDTVDDLLDTEVAAIKTVVDAVKLKTDNLPSDPADESSIQAAISAVSAKVDTVDDFLDTEIAAIKAKTDALPADPADESNVLAAISAVSTKVDTVDDFLDTEIAAIKAKTDNLPASPAAVGSAMTLTSAYDFAKGTVAMLESYAANGAAPTPAQAMMAIHQMLMHFEIAGTNITVKRLDGSTNAFVVALNDDTNPSAAARA
jgi:ActR/RegA family two-component response regulator